jgi:hypothetical protein
MTLIERYKSDKNAVILEKKTAIKYADAICVNNHKVIKSDTVSRELVINTTNYLDSHGDVHMKGIWNKSIKDKKNFYLLQEHKMKFENIIESNVPAKVKEYSFRELGYDSDMTTEALVFEAVISMRNKFMYEQYKNGYVTNHSVAMQYVKIEFCVNSGDEFYKEEKANWDKYISEVANREDAENLGYFWAVLEAKIIEGSAVPIGSNPITPTIEPSSYTQNNKSAALSTDEMRQLFKKSLNI